MVDKLSKGKSWYNDEDMAATKVIATVLKEKGFTNAKALRVPQFKVTPGRVEVWFSAKKFKYSLRFSLCER